MLGLIIMSGPLAMAIGLSAVAIAQIDPDRSAGDAREGPEPSNSRKFHENRRRRTDGMRAPGRLHLEFQP